jgi:hypothetical protein
MRIKDFILACDLNFKQYVNANSHSFAGKHAYQLLNLSELTRLINYAYTEDGGVYVYGPSERVLITISGIYTQSWKNEHFRILDGRIGPTDAQSIKRRFLEILLEFEQIGQTEKRNLLHKLAEIMMSRKSESK